MLCFLICFALRAFAATGGSLSGAVVDASGAAMGGASLSLVNDAQQTPYRTNFRQQGLYSSPNLPVGRYTLTIVASGFARQRRVDLAVDSDAAIRVDVTLKMATQTDTVTVSSNNGARIDLAATHLGEVVSAERDDGIADQRTIIATVCLTSPTLCFRCNVS